MPNNIGLLRDLLGSFIGQQAPETNQNYRDANGVPVPGQSPYVVGGWGTRFFHPEVYNYETQQNNAGINALNSAEANRTATRTVGRQDLGTIPQQYYPDSTASPDANVTLSGGDFTAPGLRRSQESAADIRTGVPQSNAALKQAGNVYDQSKFNVLNGLDTGSLAGINANNDILGSLRRQAYSLSNRGPELNAQAEIARNQFEGAHYPAETAMIAPRTDAERIGLLAQQQAAQRAIGGSSNLNRLYDTDLQAKIKEAEFANRLGGFRLGAVNDIGTELANQAKTGATQSFHPAAMPNLYSTDVTEKGLTEPQRNPLALTKMQQMEGQLGANDKVSPAAKAAASALGHPSIISSSTGERVTGAQEDDKKKKKVIPTLGAPMQTPIHTPDADQERVYQMILNALTHGSQVPMRDLKGNLIIPARGGAITKPFEPQ